MISPFASPSSLAAFRSIICTIVQYRCECWCTKKWKRKKKLLILLQKTFFFILFYLLKEWITCNSDDHPLDNWYFLPASCACREMSSTTQWVANHIAIIHCSLGQSELNPDTLWASFSFFPFLFSFSLFCFTVHCLLLAVAISSSSSPCCANIQSISLFSPFSFFAAGFLRLLPFLYSSSHQQHRQDFTRRFDFTSCTVSSATCLVSFLLLLLLLFLVSCISKVHEQLHWLNWPSDWARVNRNNNSGRHKSQMKKKKKIRPEKE